MKEYYMIQSNAAKDQHLLRHIEVCDINKRERKDFKGKKKCSWKYYLFKGTQKVQVCREFFLCSLSISHSRLETLRKSLNEQGNPTPTPSHQPATTIPDTMIDVVREHIKSFPCVESHYCRSTTKRKYLDRSLSVPKMYSLYQEQMAGRMLPTMKFWKYNQIFTTEFNLGFHKPKSDLCDRCTEWEVTPDASKTDESRADHKRHTDGKKDAENLRKEDKANNDPGTLVVSFDLENVFALPRTPVSSAFYKSKLNCYNLTAVVGRTKEAFSAVWVETTSGRSGNDLASALIHLLDTIIPKYPDTKNIILWSDSCVAQNKNQIMSYAIQLYLETNTQLNTIIHRYCEPGHSNIQDVDNLHSNIERSLRHKEIHSPVSLVRLLKQVRPSGKDMYVSMLRPADFLDYKSVALANGTYDKVGFASVKEIHYSSSNVREIAVKKDRAATATTKVSVLTRKVTRGGQIKPLAKPKPLPPCKQLTKKKADDIRSLVRFLTGDDKIFMENILANNVATS